MAAAKYINQLITNIQKLIDNNPIIVGNFNTPLTTTDRSSKQKINKETMALNDTLDWMDLTDIFRTFHPKVVEYTFFSSVHGTFSRSHSVPQISPQQVQKDLDHTMHIFRPQRYETQNQPQEKMWKVSEFLDIK